MALPRDAHNHRDTSSAPLLSCRTLGCQGLLQLHHGRNHLVLRLGPEISIAVPTRLDGRPNAAGTAAFNTIPLQDASEARLNGGLVSLNLFKKDGFPRHS